MLWNRYVYVGNDPINFVDPSGLLPEWMKKIGCQARAAWNGFVDGVAKVARWIPIATAVLFFGALAACAAVPASCAAAAWVAVSAEALVITAAIDYGAYRAGEALAKARC